MGTWIWFVGLFMMIGAAVFIALADVEREKKARIAAVERRLVAQAKEAEERRERVSSKEEASSCGAEPESADEPRPSAGSPYRSAGAVPRKRWRDCGEKPGHVHDAGCGRYTYGPEE